jgi:hypothetical protein
MEPTMMDAEDSMFEFLKPLNELPFQDASARLALALIATWKYEGLGQEEFDAFLNLMSQAFATSTDRRSAGCSH